jgi:hypothetical protein
MFYLLLFILVGALIYTLDLDHNPANLSEEEFREHFCKSMMGMK